LDVLLVTKAFQDSTEGAIVIGSSVVEVEVDGETNYKVVFELEATEETIQAAQQELEEEITRMNNSLCPSAAG
jgi:predicted phosphoribosyltransferase